MYDWLIPGVACLVALPYALLPIVIKQSVAMNTDAPFGKVHLESLPAPTEKFFREEIPKLEALGFSLYAVMSCLRAGSNVRNYVSVLGNSETKTLALVTVVAGVVEGEELINTYYVEFIAQFPDDAVVSTFNSTELGAFKTPVGSTKIQLPHVKDEKKLYDIHLAATKAACAGRPLLFPDVADWADYIKEQINKQHAQQEKTGLMKFDPIGKCYRPTWFGAYKMTWGELWPFKPLRRACLQKEALKQEARFSA